MKKSILLPIFFLSLISCNNAQKQTSNLETLNTGAWDTNSYKETDKKLINLEAKGFFHVRDSFDIPCIFDMKVYEDNIIIKIWGSGVFEYDSFGKEFYLTILFADGHHRPFPVRRETGPGSMSFLEFRPFFGNGISNKETVNSFIELLKEEGNVTAIINKGLSVDSLKGYHYDLDFSGFNNAVKKKFNGKIPK